MALSHRIGEILAIAANNHHLVETSALRAAGITGSQTTQLVRDRVLERIIRGLFRIPGTRTPIQDIAATVSRHRDAHGSHVSALYVYDLDVRPPRRPQFTLEVHRSGHTTLGVLHRSPLDMEDRTIRHGIPVTTLPRAIVDAAESMGADALAAVVNEAVSRRLTSVDEVAAALERVEQAPGRLGSGRIREVLGSWTDAIRPDSPAEAAAIRRIVGHGLPVPDTQVEIRDSRGNLVARADMAWPSRLVLREYDSDRFHGPDRIEADERRRRRLEAMGWSVGVVTRRDLRPSAVEWLRILERDLRAGPASAAS